jgi:hypothetical protein
MQASEGGFTFTSRRLRPERRAGHLQSVEHARSLEAIQRAMQTTLGRQRYVVSGVTTQFEGKTYFALRRASELIPMATLRLIIRREPTVKTSFDDLLILTTDPAFETKMQRLRREHSMSEFLRPNPICPRRRQIVAEVAQRGDAGRSDFTERFDKIALKPSEFRIPAAASRPPTHSLTQPCWRRCVRHCQHPPIPIRNLCRH